MRGARVFFVVLGALLSLVPAASADDVNCESTQTIKVSGLIAVADVQVCEHHQDEFGEIGDIGTFGIRVTMPNVAATPTIAVTPGTPIGCTIGTATVRTLSGSNGASSSYFNTYTSTDTTCAIALRVTIAISSTTVFDEDYAFSSHCTCAHQRLDITSWPTLNVGQSGSWGIAVAGIPDTQEELQAVADAINALTALQGEALVLDGGVDVDVVDDTTDDGMLTTPSPFLNNSTLNATTNVAAQLAVTETTGRFWFPVAFWFFGLVYFLVQTRPKLMAAGACLVGIAVSVFTHVAWTQAGALLFLAIAIVVEAVAGDRIYERLFPKKSGT